MSLRDRPREVGGRREQSRLAAAMLLLSALGLAAWLLPRAMSSGDVVEAEAQFRLALGHSQHGDLHGAAEALRRAVALRPRWPDAHIQLGTTYYELGEFALAREALETGVRLVPGEAIAWGRLGKLYLATGELEKAEKALLAAERLQPDQVTYPSLLGEVYRQRGDAASATKSIAAFRRALALQPGHAVAHHRLGLAYQRLGRLDEAAAALTAATRRAPREPDPYYALAQVERLRGHTAAADRALRTFRRLDRQRRTREDEQDRP